MWSKKWYFKRNISRDARLLNELLDTDVPWDDAIVVSAGKLRKLWDSLSQLRILCVKDDWKGHFWCLRYCLSKLRSFLSFSVGKIAQFNWERIRCFRHRSSVCGTTHQQMLSVPVGWPARSDVIGTSQQHSDVMHTNKAECQTRKLLCVFCLGKKASQLNRLFSTERCFTSRNTKVFAFATVKS